MCQHIERPSWLGSYSVDQCIRHLKEHGEWGSTLILCIRHLQEHPGWCPALYFTMFSICWASLTIVVTADASMWGERGYGDCSTHIHVTQWYRLAYVAAWFSSTGVSYHSLFPHTPSLHISAVNSSLRPVIVPESLNSSSQTLCLSGDTCPSLGYAQL